MSAQLAHLALQRSAPLLRRFLITSAVPLTDSIHGFAQDDVEANSFNILRAFVHLYGAQAPLKLVGG